MKWDSELGTWSIVSNRSLIIRGTTFRNAGYLTLEVGTPDHSIDFFLGRHIGVTLWGMQDCKMYQWKPKRCRCYGCLVYRPISLQAAKAMSAVMKNAKGKKLPPRNRT